MTVWFGSAFCTMYSNYLGQVSSSNSWVFLIIFILKNQTKLPSVLSIAFPNYSKTLDYYFSHLLTPGLQNNQGSPIASEFLSLPVTHLQFCSWSLCTTFLMSWPLVILLGPQPSAPVIFSGILYLTLLLWGPHMPLKFTPPENFYSSSLSKLLIAELS